MRYAIACAIFFVGLIISCSEKKTSVVTEALNPPTPTFEKVKVIRLEQKIFNQPTRNSIQALWDTHPYFSEKFLKRSQYPNDSILTNAFYRLATHKSLDSIKKICDNVYGDFSDISNDLNQAFDHVKKYIDPSFTPPVIYTILTGMGNDLYVDDSIAVVGLEFFLAENCRYVPDFPGYIVKRYRKEFIAPMIITLLAQKYNRSEPADNSLLAEMVYYGKSYYFLKQTMPWLPDTLIAGYDADVYADIQKNLSVIWAHFVEKNLFYETKYEITNRYVGERPAVVEIGKKCPGRIGRWLGWQIVNAYMERNPNVTLKELMAEKDARKIFNLSKYKPKNTA